MTGKRFTGPLVVCPPPPPPHTKQLPPPTLWACPPPPPLPPVVAKVKMPYTAQGDGQLSLKPGQVIRVRQQRNDGWWEGELQSRGQKKQVGWFPSTHVELLPSSSKRRENPPPSRSISIASTVSAISTTSTAVQEQAPSELSSTTRSGGRLCLHVCSD